MFDDTSNPGVSFNPRPPPIQQDDRSVNQIRGENRDRGKFQKLLKGDQKGDLEGEEELAAATAAGAVSGGVNTTKAKAGNAGDQGLKEHGKDGLMALLNEVDQKGKPRQGGTSSGGGGTGAFAASADGKNIAIGGIAGTDAGEAGGSGSVKDAEASKRVEMWQMLEKLVDTITAMKSDGKTETTVTLNEPRLFQGAVIKIDEYDQAKGQFNIAFQNLSPDAKSLIDANKDGLKKALEERGYMLHIVTTTLELDKPQAAQNQGQPFFQQRQGGQQQQGRQQREQPQQQDDDDF